MAWGNDVGKWGLFESAKLFHWSTLAYMVLVAVITWALEYVFPVLDGLGGYWTLISPVLVPVLRALLLKYSDNTEKRL